jgi:hypothetical protein
MKERLNAEVLSSETGFICYSDHPETNSLFIRDYYAEPQFRKGPRARENFIAIMKLARGLGRTSVTGFVSEENDTYVRSLKSQLNQGFKISAVSGHTVYTYINVAEFFKNEEKRGE